MTLPRYQITEKIDQADKTKTKRKTTTMKKKKAYNNEANIYGKEYFQQNG